MYHNSGLLCTLILYSLSDLTSEGDVSDRPGYDLEQIRSIAKATVRKLSIFLDVFI